MNPPRSEPHSSDATASPVGGRAAFVLAATGTLVAAVGGASLLTFTMGPRTGWLAVGLTSGIAPVLLGLALVALTIDRISPVRRVSAAIAATIAFPAMTAFLLSLTAVSTAADGGVPAPALARLWPLWFVVAWLAASLALTLVFTAQPGTRRWPRALGSLVLAPAILAASLWPVMVVLAGVALLAVLTALSPRAARRSLPVRTAAMRRAAPLALAVMGTVLGCGGVAFALLGGHAPDGLDGTAAMQLGMAAGHFAAVPLVAALWSWLRVPERTPVALLLAAALAIAAAGDLLGFLDEPAMQWSATVLAAGALGAACNLVLFIRLPGSRATRSASALAAALGLTVTLGPATVLTLPFVAPLAGAALTWWLARPGGLQRRASSTATT